MPEIRETTASIDGLDTLIESLGEIVAKRIDKLKAKIQELEARLDERPKIVEGPPGEQGIQGLPGERGLAGERGEQGSPGDIGPQGNPGERGLAGEPGRPGEAGARGEKGLDGKDGRDGRDGINGKDGRDALQIDILPAIDLAKSYSRGTIARFKGGLLRAYHDTAPIDETNLEAKKAGWEVIVEGIADLEMKQTDERTFLMRASLTSGKEIQYSFKSPVQIYRGVYKRGQEYHRGDTVTWSGSQWHCDKDSTKSEPDKGDDWTLAVREGRAARPQQEKPKQDREPISLA